MMMAAMGLSVLFLLSYVAYHFTSNEVKFGDVNLDGSCRCRPNSPRSVAARVTVYLLLLITHIVSGRRQPCPSSCSPSSPAWTNRFAAHRRLARWVYPMWLYVAITGPVCYWMLRPYYP
jgi:putative membrane protein